MTHRLRITVLCSVTLPAGTLGQTCLETRHSNRSHGAVDPQLMSMNQQKNVTKVSLDRNGDKTRFCADKNAVARGSQEF